MQGLTYKKVLPWRGETNNTFCILDYTHWSAMYGNAILNDFFWLWIWLNINKFWFHFHYLIIYVCEICQDLPTVAKRRLSARYSSKILRGGLLKLELVGRCFVVLINWRRKMYRFSCTEGVLACQNWCFYQW